MDGISRKEAARPEAAAFTNVLREVVLIIGRTARVPFRPVGLLSLCQGHSSCSGLSVYVYRFPQPATSRTVRDPPRRRVRSAGDVSGGASDN